MSHDPTYAAKLEIAKAIPLPLQLTLTEKNSDVSTRIFANTHFRTMAEKLEWNEVDVSNNHGEVFIGFNFPWDDRQAFLALVRGEFGDMPACGRFLGAVEAAEIMFVNTIELDDA